MPGAATSEVEVSVVSTKGLWLWFRGDEHFLDFEHFPWFRKARLDEVMEVEVHGADRLHWPRLDVDLTVEMIEHPDRFPLVARGA